MPHAPRVVGALRAVLALALTLVLAEGVADLAHRDLVPGLWLLAGSLAGRWLLDAAVDEWSDRASRRIRAAWRTALLTHFERPRTEGERARGDLGLAIEHASGEPVLSALRAGAQASILGLAAVFWSAGWLPTTIIVALLVLAIPLYQRAGRRSAVLELEYHQRRATLEQRQLELLEHGPELRALGAVEFGADEIAAISDSEHAIALRTIRVALGSSLVTEFLSGVSVGLVAMVVGFALLGGRLSLVRALIAVLVTSELFGHVRRYGSEFHRREQAATSARRLAQVEPTPKPSGGPSLVRAVDLVTEASSVPLDLEVLASSRTLVTGPSGVGKTTLLHTLLGWRAPRAGSVARANATVGFVSAESALLEGSLWENLTLGRDVDATQVEELLSDLGLDGPRFRDLSSTLLAEGRGLSSGERVRLVLARCLLAEPALLILDDIAGVLDVPTRGRVASVLERRRGTAIVEATVDTPVLAHVERRIELHP